MSTEKMLTELGESFEAFKARYDARIDEIEAKGNRLGNTPYTPGSDHRATAQQIEHKKAFLNSFIRKGLDNGLRDMEINNAISTGSDPDGGYGVPEELDRNVASAVRNAVPMRQLCNVISGTIGYSTLRSSNSAGFEWVGELDTRSVTDTSTLIKLTPYFGEISAMPSCSQNSLDDIFFDVESWISEELKKAFISAEGAAFLTGNATLKPKGILAYPTSAAVDGARAFGTIQHVACGAASAFPATSATFNPYDVLLDLVGSLKAAYRQNASFLMNKNTLTFFRKCKTALEGDFVVSPATATMPASILGHPVHEDENMPDIGTDSLPVLFGDFKRAYTIVDVGATRVLRDPYTSKPNVMFYTTKRVGGFLADSEAIKVLKIAAS